MDWNLYKNYLLNSIPGAKVVSGGREILCRCRECPDSTDPNHAHFYISIPYDSDKDLERILEILNIKIDD